MPALRPTTRQDLFSLVVEMADGRAAGPTPVRLAPVSAWRSGIALDGALF